MGIRQNPDEHLRAYIDEGGEPLRLLEELSLDPDHERDPAFVKNVIIPKWDRIVQRLREGGGYADTVTLRDKKGDDFARLKRRWEQTDNAVKYYGALLYFCWQKAGEHGPDSPVELIPINQPRAEGEPAWKSYVLPLGRASESVTSISLPPEAREACSLPKDEGDYPNPRSSSFQFEIRFDAGGTWREATAKVERAVENMTRRRTHLIREMKAEEFNLELLSRALDMYESTRGDVHSWREMYPAEEEWMSIDDLPLTPEEERLKGDNRVQGAHLARHMVNMLKALEEAEPRMRPGHAQSEVLRAFGNPFGIRSLQSHISKLLPHPTLSETEKTKYMKLFRHLTK